MASVIKDKKLVNTAFMQFPRRDIVPPTLPILKDKIASSNQAVNVVDNDILEGLARPIVTTMYALINKLRRVFTCFVYIVIEFISKIFIELAAVYFHPECDYL